LKGQYFDMDPEVLTLENIFNMDLARYKETCLEIVANSVKELSIERSINDVEKVYINFVLYYNQQQQ